MAQKKGRRYDVSHLTENQHQPGSRGRVLKNLLAITAKREMDLAEAEALKKATDTLVRSYDFQHRFTAEDICRMHLTWLSQIYPWAGRYRQVNLVKDDLPFAAASQVPQLMQAFEEGPLRRHTPCNFSAPGRVIEALAEVHVEFILIHPFREGNGRVGRILSTLMALQANLPLLDFRPIHGRRKEAYFAAVRAGLDRNYKPMEEIFELVLNPTSSGT
jgi:cell filamentation protein